MRTGSAILAILAVVAAGAILLLGDRGERVPSPAMPARADCPELGTRDRNPADRRVPPALAGERLLPRRRDGRLPFGFNDHAGLVGQVPVDEDADLLEGIGADLWRVAIDWRHAEPEPGRLDLAAYDAIYCVALSRDIRPVFVIAAAPAWAADAGRSCAAPSCLSPPAPRHLPALRDFAERVAIRYPEAAAVEAWNEPNLAAFWAEPDPRGYVAALRAIYAGVKDGNPRTPVLGGSLSNTTRTAPAQGKIAGVEFARAIYRTGAARHMDAIAFHPYPVDALEQATERYSETIAGLRRVVAQHDPGRRIWITEVGLATRADAATEAEQARSMLAVYRELERAGDVDAVLFHTLVDPDARIKSAPGFGWLAYAPGGEVTPKRAYCEFAERLGDGMPLPCVAAR